MTQNSSFAILTSKFKALLLRAREQKKTVVSPMREDIENKKTDHRYLFAYFKPLLHISLYGRHKT